MYQNVDIDDIIELLNFDFKQQHSSRNHRRCWRLEIANTDSVHHAKTLLPGIDSKTQEYK